MNADNLQQRSKCYSGVVVILLATITVAIISVFPRTVSPVSAQTNPGHDALWDVVHNLCVPGQSLHHDPAPCLQVNLAPGIEHGFAILQDPRGGTQFVLIPTARISGIESPIVRAADATNYFAGAWEARALIGEFLHRPLPRDHVGLAINSAAGRSQDQLHIHFSCVRPEIADALRTEQLKVADRWRPFNVPLLGHPYVAMWVPGEQLGPRNPFKLLAELPDATRDMGEWTLVVVGMTRRDGTKGFVILADHVDKAAGDNANGEELLDRECRVSKKYDSRNFPYPHPHADHFSNGVS